MKVIATTLLIVCVLVSTGCAFLFVPSQQELAVADYGEYPADYKDIVERYLQEVLIDPHSVSDLSISVPKEGWHTRPFSVVFGYKCSVSYNAKNRYGGYVGRKTYFVLIRNGQLLYFEEVRPSFFGIP